MESFDSIPEILKEPIFKKGFKIAEIAGYSKEELDEYEESLKVYRDLKGVIDTSFEEGLKEGEKAGLEKGEKIGIEKGIKIRNKEMVIRMHGEGMSPGDISRFTGLSKAEIMTIIEEIKQDK